MMFVRNNFFITVAVPDCAFLTAQRTRFLPIFLSGQQVVLPELSVCKPPCIKNVAAGVWLCCYVDLESFVPISELMTGVVSRNANNNNAGAGESLNNLWG